MAGLGGLLLEKEILLESGTNEVEILVFHVGSLRLGVNVAKVREVLEQKTVVQVPEAHPSLLGCVRVRNNVAPCVSLRRHLGESLVEHVGGKMILMEFNSSQTAFMVDDIERIHRVSWNQIAPVPELLANSSTPVTGVATLEGRLVTILDFESILADISGQHWEQGVEASSDSGQRKDKHLVLVDDSANIRKAIAATLRNNGYARVTTFENGHQAWQWFEQQLSTGASPDTIADLLISDVEMPMMDGLHLTRRVKEHPLLKSLRVILFSSIMTPDNHKKGLAVGADAQLTKPEFGQLVRLADQLLELSDSCVPV
jgi:two-component system chemotaxis response regulator CheV